VRRSLSAVKNLFRALTADSKFCSDGTCLLPTLLLHHASLTDSRTKASRIIMPPQWRLAQDIEISCREWASVGKMIVFPCQIIVHWSQTLASLTSIGNKDWAITDHSYGRPRLLTTHHVLSECSKMALIVDCSDFHQCPPCAIHRGYGWCFNGLAQEFLEGQIMKPLRQTNGKQTLISWFSLLAFIESETLSKGTRRISGVGNSARVFSCLLVYSL
jgi:hypothetical protein